MSDSQLFYLHLGLILFVVAVCYFGTFDCEDWRNLWATVKRYWRAAYGTAA